MTTCDTSFAQIEVLAPEQSSKILFSQSMVILRVLTKLSPIVFFIGVAILIFGGIPRESGPSLFLPSFFVATFLMVLAALISMRDLKNHWLRRVARRVVSRRSGSLVAPDSGAWFVEVVPKANWEVRSLPESATDVGFLAFDFQARILLFEGDRERYRIPADALLDCRQDSYSRSVTLDKYGAKQQIGFYFVVVTVRISDTKIIEIPFRIRITDGLFTDKRQRYATTELLRDVERLKDEITNAA